METGRTLVRLDRHARRLPTDDRRILEEIILPALGRDVSVRRILFVGSHEFSSWYPRLFRFCRSVRFETIDPDPRAASHGAPRRHWVATLQDAGRMQELAEAYDALLVNGVFAFGIDTHGEKRDAIDAIYALLRRGGTVVVGYRARLGAPDVDLSMFEPIRFGAAPIPGLAVSYRRTAADNDHVFACFRKL